MQMQIARYLLIILSVLLIQPAAWSQTDTITVRREAQLHESPAKSAPSLAALPVQTQLTRLASRRGPWIEVRTAQGQTGWVHMFDVGTTPVASGGNLVTGALRGLTSFFGGGKSRVSQSGGVTPTIGIRGLEAEDIANAQPDMSAVASMETLHVNAALAQQFATAAALSAYRIEPLPVPERPAATPMPGSPGSMESDR